MDSLEALTCLSTQRVCSLTTVLPNVVPHAAVMHYSHSTNPLVTIFSVDKMQRKSQALLAGVPHPASVAIGFSEDEWITLQLDRTIRMLLAEPEITEAKKTHYAKIPSSQEYESDPSNVFLAFTPTWCRYTDFNTESHIVVRSGTI